MSLIKRYLEERKGIDSLMRLQSLMTLIFAFIIITWQMIEGEIYFNLDALLITAGFAPKALQKFAEASLYKNSKNKGEENE
ncbi:MAG TPA: hypothetical protein PKN32_10615 [Bacteroidales bacterium]|nr:hypothetical protein [Bacteroidales bacterium]